MKIFPVVCASIKYRVRISFHRVAGCRVGDIRLHYDLNHIKENIATGVNMWELRMLSSIPRKVLCKSQHRASGIRNNLMKLLDTSFY